MPSLPLRKLAFAAISGSMVFGVLAALDTPALAQTITVKCWKEYCVTDPDTGKETCVREQIDCPQQQ